MRTEQELREESTMSHKPCKEQLLATALPILQGLLASGHYTKPDTDTDCVKVQTVDNGNGWEGIWATRTSTIAVNDAIEIATELINQVELDSILRMTQFTHNQPV
jgi:hypothetical protein